MDRVDLRVGVLGPVQVIRAGTPVAVPRGRPSAMLAVLALAGGRTVTPAALAERVWGERQPARATAGVQTVVARLRRVLGGAAIATSPTGYALNVEPDHIDVVRFRRLVAGAGTAGADAARELLAEALALWRDEPLAGLGDQPPDWPEVGALVEERLSAWQRRIDLDLAAGRHADLVPELRELVGRHPTRETLWYQLMSALAGAGRPADAVDVYHQGRARLADELGLDPSPQMEELYRRLLAGRPAAEPVAVTTVPRQLPTDIRQFVGRDRALARLDELLAGWRAGSRDGTLLVAVDGGGGIGKTALAVHWAHRVRDDFPGGQLFLNLHGYGPKRPVGPAAALETLLRALGLSTQDIPDGVEPRSALLRSVLADRQALLVLDNARDADQVRPLLPGTGCAVLVTSRNQLRGLASRDGAHRVTLDHLGDAEARQLLAAGVGTRRLAGAEPAVRALLDRCGGLPLALRITAEWLGRHPDLPLPELVADLAARGGRLDALSGGPDQSVDLRAVLSWSYDALDGAAARLFRLLGLHPGADIGTAAGAALAGLAEPASRADLDNRLDRLLDELVAAHLVEEHRPGRYQLHDLVHDYATEQAHRYDPTADRAAALDRLIDWYLHTAVNASRLLRPDKTHDVVGPPAPGTVPGTFDGYDAALRWQRAEYPTMLALVRHAERHGLDQAAWLLTWALGAYFLLDTPDTWVECAEYAARAADRLATPEARCHAYNSLGLGCFSARRYEEAVRANRVAVDAARALGDREREAMVLCNLGLALYKADRSAEARACNLEARDIYRELGHRVGEAVALVNLGAIAHSLHEYEEALRHHREALALERQLDFRTAEALTLGNLAEVHLAMDDDDQARRYAEEALAMNLERQDHHFAGFMLLLLGRIEQRAGRLDGARARWQEAAATLPRTSVAERDEVEKLLAAG